MEKLHQRLQHTLIDKSATSHQKNLSGTRKVFVGKKSNWIPFLLGKLQDSPTKDHTGAPDTYKHLRRFYNQFWKNLLSRLGAKLQPNSVYPPPPTIRTAAADSITTSNWIKGSAATTQIPLKFTAVEHWTGSNSYTLQSLPELVVHPVPNFWMLHQQIICHSASPPSTVPSTNL
jgi:hypothetical protein